MPHGRNPEPCPPGYCFICFRRFGNSFLRAVLPHEFCSLSPRCHSEEATSPRDPETDPWMDNHTSVSKIPAMAELEAPTWPSRTYTPYTPSGVGPYDMEAPAEYPAAMNELEVPTGFSRTHSFSRPPRVEPTELEAPTHREQTVGIHNGLGTEPLSQANGAMPREHASRERSTRILQSWSASRAAEAVITQTRNSSGIALCRRPCLCGLTCQKNSAQGELQASARPVQTPGTFVEYYPPLGPYQTEVSCEAISSDTGANRPLHRGRSAVNDLRAQAATYLGS